MKRCLTCGAIYPSACSGCRLCAAEPESRCGFPAYAPSLAESGGGFKASYFSELAPLEAGHFWFEGRNALVIWALGKYCPSFHSFLEIGCGTGFVLSGIGRAYPGVELSGSEIFTSGLHFAAARLPGAAFIQMDATDIPFVEEFDAIGAFDVLEHIADDEQVLLQMNAALKPGGVILLSVPQHTWLWSPVDDHACHVRRYAAGELHEKVRGGGFEILRSTSFVTSLLPALFASRLARKAAPAQDVEAAAELRINPLLNRLFKKALDAEITMIGYGVNFPVGGSRLIIARKN